VAPAPDAGTVGFSDGSAAMTGCGARPVDAATGIATCQYAISAAGSHVVVVSYVGSAGFAASVSAPLAQTVEPAPPADGLPPPVALLPVPVLPVVPVAPPPVAVLPRLSPAVRLASASAQASGRLILTLAAGGATTVTATAQLVPRVVKGRRQKLHRIILYGRASALTTRAGTVRLVIEARAAALRSYRAQAGRYRIRLTLTSRSGRSRPVTRQLLVASTSLRALQPASRRSMIGR
jgi:hypothetical protein